MDQIKLLAKSSVDAIVLREKDLSEAEYEALAQKVNAVCQEYRTECILHQNVEVAKRLGVKKIHLSLPLVQKYRKELEWFEKVGVSTHSLEQIRQAQECSVDYVFFGHVFATDCKKGVPPEDLHSFMTYAPMQRYRFMRSAGLRRIMQHRQSLPELPVCVSCPMECRHRKSNSTTLSKYVILKMNNMTY